MSYAGIIAKDFGQGTVCITTDTFYGYRSGHGKSSVVLWRRILELTGHAQVNEPIYVALVDNRQLDYANRLYELSPVIVESIEMDRLAAVDLSKYDVVFFAGLPTTSTENIQNKLADWVSTGGGLIIECPNISGNIGILSALDLVDVSSVQRPFTNKAYWTIMGSQNQIYTESAVVSIMTSIVSESLPVGWQILMSDVETIYEDETVIDVQDGVTAGLYTSQFSASVGCYFNNGIVTIQEGDISSSQSSESSESSVLNESMSSTSSSQVEEWNVCEDIMAQWKMNDSAGNNVIDDVTHNLLNVAYLYRGVSKRNTSSNSVFGITNKAIAFNGTNDYAKTVKTARLRMNTGASDVDFAISGWVNTQQGVVGPIICKYQSWEVGIKSGGKKLYFKKTDDSGGTIEFSGTMPNFMGNAWNFFAINSYIDGTLSADMYCNNDKLTVMTIDSGYSGENAKNNELLMGSNYAEYINGFIDNVMVFSRVLEANEIESLYNRGNGMEDCEGIFYYTSSSSTSSSSLDSSSSSTSSNSSSSSSKNYSTSSTSSSTNG